MELINSYLTKINTGALPDIKDTWKSVALIENTKLLEETIKVTTNCRPI